jgi:asparagine synthase (glutamine-hydrolysing)
LAQDVNECRRLLQLADAEAWCTHWHGRAASAVAAKRS